MRFSVPKIFASLGSGAAFLVAASLLLPLTSARADTLLFSDNFDAGNSGASWMVNKNNGTDSFANFAFDYSTLGIGAAPKSTGGSTIGARFLVNQSAGVQQGISASPINQHFTGDFRMQFDAFFNFVGPAPLGGSGSTQAGTFGYGTKDNTAQTPFTSAANSSIIFAATTDGNSSADYRVYKNAVNLAPTSGVYAAGTGATAQDQGNAYYVPLGNATAPAAQTALYASQTGTTSTGTFGMKWRDVIIDKAGNILTWNVDGLKIATVDITGQTLNGDNIFLGMFDTNATSSADANDFLNAAIFDNLTVTQIQAAPVPEPGTWAMMGLGCLALGLTGWRRKRDQSASLGAELQA